MESFTEKFERIFSAVTFAEAGEFETARGILNESPASTVADLLSSDTTIDDLISTAITFAEAGEHDKALETMKEVNDKLSEIKAARNRTAVSATN
jgi:cellobiose-specific phosphotransferase system component IIA